MGNLGMVLCIKEDAVPEENLFRQLSAKFSTLWNRKKVEINLQCTDLYEGLKFYVIVLPFKPSEIAAFKKGNQNRFSSTITDLCSQNHITSCILSENIPESFQPEGCSRGKFSGQHLYKSILHLIFEEIFTKRGIKICDLDITIIHGENNVELFGIINMISPMIKYLTVITDNKAAVEEEMNRIVSETGLAVSIVSPNRSLMRKADIIINLAICKEGNALYRVNPKAMVINCNQDVLNRTFQGNVFIQGFMVRLPKEITENMDAAVLQGMSSVALAEMLLSHRLGIENISWEQELNAGIMDRLSRQFRKDGYKIEGFIGRYGVLKNIDIRLYGT